MKLSEQKDKEYIKYEYLKEQNMFEIFGYNDDKWNYYPILNLTANFCPDNFDMYMLENRRTEISENSIYKVQLDGERVGWIFPVQSLVSKEHEYAENEFFLNYSYIAICKLIEGIGKNIEDYQFDEINLLDFYAAEQHLLIFDHDNLKKIIDFRINDYTISLFSKGYSYTGQGNVFTDCDPIDKNLNLTKLPIRIRNIEYINILFKEYIPIRVAEYATFHILYQVIEILIGVVFEIKFNDIISDLKNDAGSLFNKKEDLSEITGEKNRIRWLFSNFTRVSDEKRELLNACCLKVLEENGKKPFGEDMPSNLYAVRCLIVHNLYILKSTSYVNLEELNTAFLDVLIDILLKFHD